MPTHTPAKRAINRRKLAQARKLGKEVASNRKAGAKKIKTVSGLARNAAARPRSRRK